MAFILDKQLCHQSGSTGCVNCVDLLVVQMIFPELVRLM